MPMNVAVDKHKSHTYHLIFTIHFYGQRKYFATKCFRDKRVARSFKRKFQFLMTLKTRFCGEAKNRSSTNEFCTQTFGFRQNSHHLTRVTICSDNQPPIVDVRKFFLIYNSNKTINAFRRKHRTLLLSILKKLYRKAYLD